MHWTRMRWALALIAVGCAPLDEEAPLDGPVDTAVRDTGEAWIEELVDARLPDAVVDDLLAGATSRVIVQIDDHHVPRDRGLREWARSFRATADHFEEDLPLGTLMTRRYDNLPFMVVDVWDIQGALELADRPDVVHIMEDLPHEPMLDTSLDLIGQPAAVAQGYDGSGTSVVVLDTGADYGVADLGNCTAVGTPSSCRVVYAADFAAPDGTLDDNSNHGTNVSAIVAQTAPGTDIIALDVFESNGSAYSNVILAAVDWAITNQDTYNIAAVNMSLGGGLYSNECGNLGWDSAFAQARAAGISLIVASGNDGQKSKISSPACSPEAFSVGAVYDTTGHPQWCGTDTVAGDNVVCFSNSASFLDIMAPGTFINAGGFTMSGTSMATPHVAGAAAVIRQAWPVATVDQLEDLMRDTGASVTDYRNGLTFPRIDMEAAIDHIVGGGVGDPGCAPTVSDTELAPSHNGESGVVSVSNATDCDWTASSDADWLTVTPASGTGNATVSWTAAVNPGGIRTAILTVAGTSIAVTQAAGPAPTGTVVINGDAAATNNNVVTLTINADGADLMCISSNDSCSRFEPYAETVFFRLKGSPGTHQVRVWFANSDLTYGSPASDTIIYDKLRPSDGTLMATLDDGEVQLKWKEFDDDLSGIDHYIVTELVGGRTPRTSCTMGTVWTGSEKMVTLTNLDFGQAHGWRVCAVDVAGNISKGATVVATPKVEFTPPVGTIALDAGAEYTNSSEVQVHFSATDASGVSEVCVSTRSTRCTNWVPMAPSVSIRVRGIGQFAAYAWFKDPHGNVSEVASDTIMVDPKTPRDGSVDAESLDGAAIQLSWNGFTDESGIASYRVMQIEGTAAPAVTCSGTPVWTGSTGPATIPGLDDGAIYTFRVCAVDPAGNVSRGATVSAQAVPESDGPVGTIELNAGDEWSPSTTVTATLSASDPAGVVKMCLTTKSSCTRWVDYAETVTLNVGRGTATVSVAFEDGWGNRSQPVSASISVDRSRPKDGTVVRSSSSSTSVTLNWSGFFDADSGIVAYKVVKRLGSSPPRSSCRDDGQVVVNATSLTVTGLTPGETYSYRVCAIDAVGIHSRGATITPVVE